MSPLSCAPLPLDGPVHQPACEFDSLKIIIVGTPKAGNTWLRYLLAELYHLPMVALDPDFRVIDWNAFGPRWVGQQHYPPEPELIALAKERGFVFVTPVRHPGDVFVSLRHYTDNREERDNDPEHIRTMRPDSMLDDGAGNYGKHSLHYAKRGYYLKTHLSIYWLRCGVTHGVRYEDLWQRPIETFKALTDRLVPQPLDKVRRALCACEIGVMQSTKDQRKTFMRKGGLNSWVQELPPKIQTVLREQEPYPAQFAALGYTMNPQDPANTRVTEPARAGNPFPGGTFSNGVPLAPILLHIYFEETKQDLTRWQDGGSIAPGSFYAWLMSPAAADPTEGKGVPVITEFAHYLYRLRTDLPEVFPDVFGENRRAFGDWFLYSAALDFDFDWSFTLPVVSSWALGPADQRGKGEQ